LGFQAYFPKPATIGDLFSALAVIVDNGKALQQVKPLASHRYVQQLQSDGMSVGQHLDSLYVSNRNLMISS